MSVRIMNMVFEMDLDPKSKVVLLTLADHADVDGYCYPGQETLSRRSSVPVRTLRRVLGQLEESGLIARERRMTEDGRRKTDGYRLLPAILAGSHGPTGQNEGANRPTVAGSYSNEPSVEPSDTPPTPSEVEREFEALWSTWPKKAGKKAALTAWRRLSQTQRREIAPVLVAHAVAHGQHTPPQFIPMLSTWLNGERWNDELPVSRDRGAHRPEPPRPSGIHIPAGHVPVRDPETYQIIGSRPA